MDIKEAKKILTNMLGCGWIEEKEGEAIVTVLSELDNKNKTINDVSTYLEYYLIDNLKYEDSQEEFKKLLKMLNKGSEEE